jgi:hypothetical protein
MAATVELKGNRNYFCLPKVQKKKITAHQAAALFPCAATLALDNVQLTGKSTQVSISKNVLLKHD